ncbi:MAG: hypothetical protein K9G44_11420, partial [Melioribacteraceae bacterium]|nr:hypothetical protein [Melioribacteraceae bacterium]
ILSLTYIIFVYSNPVLYDSAILKMRMINDSVKEFFDIRANAKGSTELNESWLIGLWYVIKRNLIVLEENYYATFGILLNFKFNLLDGLFFGSGIWALAKRSFSKIKNNLKADFELFLLIWMLVYLWGISDFLWADFRRYYMQLYPGFAIIIGIGIVEIINQIKTKVEKK